MELLWDFISGGVEEFVDRGSQVFGVLNRIFVGYPVSVRPSYQELWNDLSYDEPEASPRVWISCPVGFMGDPGRAGLDDDFHVAEGRMSWAGGDTADRDWADQRVAVADVLRKSTACQAPEGVVLSGVDAVVFEEAGGS